MDSQPEVVLQLEGLAWGLQPHTVKKPSLFRNITQGFSCRFTCWNFERTTPGWGFGVRLTTSHCKKPSLFRNITQGLSCRFTCWNFERTTQGSGFGVRLTTSHCKKPYLFRNITQGVSCRFTCWNFKINHNFFHTSLLAEVLKWTNFSNLIILEDVSKILIATLEWGWIPYSTTNK